MGVATNSIVRDGDAWRCVDPAGIPDCAWYRMPLWVKLETEPTIVPSRLDLEQSREDWRCHYGMSTSMYENM